MISAQEEADEDTEELCRRRIRVIAAKGGIPLLIKYILFSAYLLILAIDLLVLIPCEQKPLP